MFVLNKESEFNVKRKRDKEAQTNRNIEKPNKESKLQTEKERSHTYTQTEKIEKKSSETEKMKIMRYKKKELYRKINRQKTDKSTKGEKEKE